MTEREDPRRERADSVSRIGTEDWLRERFPEKDWHRHHRTDGRFDLCDGTPSDCPQRTQNDGSGAAGEVSGD